MNSKLAILFLCLTSLYSFPTITQIYWFSTWETGRCGRLSFKNPLYKTAQSFHLTSNHCNSLKIISLWYGDKQNPSEYNENITQHQMKSNKYWSLPFNQTDQQTIGFCLSHPKGEFDSKYIQFSLDLETVKNPEKFSCGNGICDSEETETNCPTDCAKLSCESKRKPKPQNVKISWNSFWETGRCGVLSFVNPMPTKAEKFFVNLQICSDADRRQITSLWYAENKEEISELNGALLWIMESNKYWGLEPYGTDSNTVGFCIKHKRNEQWNEKKNLLVNIRVCGKDCKAECGNGFCETGETADNCKKDCLPTLTCPNKQIISKEASTGENLLGRHETKKMPTQKEESYESITVVKGNDNSMIIALFVMVGFLYLTGIIYILYICLNKNAKRNIQRIDSKEFEKNDLVLKKEINKTPYTKQLSSEENLPEVENNGSVEENIEKNDLIPKKEINKTPYTKQLSSEENLPEVENNRNVEEYKENANEHFEIKLE